jgi:hypothetical protein
MLLNLFKQDELYYSYRVFNIIISPIILKFLAKEVNNSFFLFYKEG